MVGYATHTGQKNSKFKTTPKSFIIFTLFIIKLSRAGTAQTLQRLATGWTTEKSEFKSQEEQDFSLLDVVQTSFRFTQPPIQRILPLMPSCRSA
jgi:hypothetical protein